MTRGAEAPSSGAETYRVVVMAKYPALGSVKTRLARRIGAEAAADLARAFVLDLDERLRRDGIAATWAYWPPEAPFRNLLRDAPLLAQEGGDLGERMAGVVERMMARDGRPVVVLGADVPHVDTAVVRTAGALLDGDAEVVLGPTDDGGYYLVGLGRVVPELFRGVVWGSAHVCAETQRRCVSLGLRLRLMPGTFDVDEAADLVRLAALLRRGTVSLPRTAAALTCAGLS